MGLITTEDRWYLFWPAPSAAVLEAKTSQLPSLALFYLQRPMLCVTTEKDRW